uniref:Transporter n=1 Tax=candidate division WOR-3 bacterium TaxID=2052148 RepID=A0A7V3UYY3_UNCW3
MRLIKVWFVALFLLCAELNGTPMIVRTGVVNKQFQVLGWVTASYSRNNKLYNWTDEQFESVSPALDVLNADLMAAIGLPGKLELTAALPVTSKKQGEANSSGIGDLMLMGRYGLIQNSILPLRAALALGLYLPTGDKDVSPALGDGSTDWGIGLSLNTANIPFITGHLRGAYWFNGKNGDIKYGNLLEYVAVLDFGVIPGLTPELAFSGSQQGRQQRNGNEEQNSELKRGYLQLLLLWKPLPMLVIRPKLALPIKPLCQGGRLSDFYPALDVWVTLP